MAPSKLNEEWFRFSVENDGRVKEVYSLGCEKPLWTSSSGTTYVSVLLITYDDNTFEIK